MEHNEAPAETVEHPTVADVQYCASLLQVPLAGLLQHVTEAHS